MFYVGQKVVCIDDSDSTGPVPVQRGKIYTIANPFIGNRLGKPCVTLIEFPFHKGMWKDRFRPVVERKTDISIFIEMLNPAQVKEPA